MSLKFVQTPIMSLVAGIGISDTSITVTPFPKDLEGVKLTMTDFGTAPTGTIDPKISDKEEIISFTGITDNGDNTATLTGVTRNLSSKSPYTTLGSGRQHGANAIFVISDNPQLFNRLASLDADNTFSGDNTFTEAVTIPEVPVADTDAASKGYVDDLDVLNAHLAGTETFTGTKTFTSTEKPKYDIHPTFVADEELIDKKYADDLAIAGAPDAGTTVKGIVEIATQAQVDAGTDTGETGAKLVPIPSLLSELNQLKLKTLTAGEDLVVGDSLMIADGTESRLINEQALVSNVGDRVFGTTWAYQSFTTGSTTTSIKRIRLTGNISTNTVTIYLRSSPTGANIASGSHFLSGGNIDITLSSNTVTPNTLYYIIITVGGANSGFTNDIYGGATSTYSRGTPGYSTDSGVTWGTPPNVTGDFYFKVYEINTIAGRVYKTRTDTDNTVGTSWYTNFIGFSNAITSLGSLATIQTSNVYKGFSGLTPGETYYLSNTPGAISSSAGTTSKKIGLALSATELLIKHDN